VLDHKAETVAATPFPKFFNAFEREQEIPDMPYEVFDKIDGSLIILFYRDGWHATTKGAFDTVQAKQAQRYLGDLEPLSRHATYLLEYVGPENRIIIGYDRPELYVLSGYWEDGTEFDNETARAVSNTMGWNLAPRRQFDSFEAIRDLCKSLPASSEGFVVRFQNGLRLKIKGDEYCRLHALVSRITPIGVWEVLRAGDDVHAVRSHIPEEFWSDFDQISWLIRKKMNAIRDHVKEVADSVAELSDKEVGLQINDLPADVRRFIFPYRQARDKRGRYKLWEALHRAVRPTGNFLEGYVPSYMMSRVQEESS
jgi:RNA ligase